MPTNDEFIVRIDADLRPLETTLKRASLLVKAFSAADKIEVRVLVEVRRSDGGQLHRHECLCGAEITAAVAVQHEDLVVSRVPDNDVDVPVFIEIPPRKGSGVVTDRDGACWRKTSTSIPEQDIDRASARCIERREVGNLISVDVGAIDPSGIETSREVGEELEVDLSVERAGRQEQEQQDSRQGSSQTQEQVRRGPGIDDGSAGRLLPAGGSRPADSERLRFVADLPVAARGFAAHVLRQRGVRNDRPPPFRQGRSAGLVPRLVSDRVLGEPYRGEHTTVWTLW